METTTISRNFSESLLEDPSAYKLPYYLWSIYESCSVILIVISMYILIVVLRFTLINSKIGSVGKQQNFSHDQEMGHNKRSLKGSMSELSFHRSSSKKKRRSKTGQSAESVRLLCLLAALFALFRIAADQLELATYGQERINCKIYQVTVVSTYAISATFVYSALWLRLRIFYLHPFMKHLASPIITFLVWFALSLIISSVLINTVMFIVTVQAQDSKYGCILGESTSVSPTLRYIILTLSTITSQGMLLSLFLYPLVKHRYKLKSLALDKPMQIAVTIAGPREQDPNSDPKVTTAWNRGSVQQSKRLRREKKLVAVIHRVLITALVCVISDVVAAVVTIALNQQPRVVSNMVFNVNLLVNIISVLFSFGDWRERLIPCFHSTKTTEIFRSQGGFSKVVRQDGKSENNKNIIYSTSKSYEAKSEIERNPDYVPALSSMYRNSNTPPLSNDESSSSTAKQT